MQQRLHASGALAFIVAGVVYFGFRLWAQSLIGGDYGFGAGQANKGLLGNIRFALSADKQSLHGALFDTFHFFWLIFAYALYREYRRHGLRSLLLVSSAWLALCCLAGRLVATDTQRVFVMMGGGNRNWRLIYTDAREQKGQIQGDADNPLYFGRAVGRWEGETLVVDTKGFNERFWFSNGGLPHTQQLHLVERFSRPDFDTLRYDVTVDDPGAYTRTWSAGWTLRWVPGEDMPEYFCQDNRP